MVKNPPASAGDMGSIPGSGRSPMLWRTRPTHRRVEPMLQSPGAAATEPELHSSRSHGSEPCTAIRERPPATAREKPTQQRRPSAAMPN